MKHRFWPIPGVFHCYDWCSSCYLMAYTGFTILNQKQEAGGGHQDHMSLVVRKPVYGVSDKVQHKPGCTATEDG